MRKRSAIAQTAPAASLRRFRWIIGSVAAIGLVLALAADSSLASGEQYWDALREIGGALIAGAAVAGLVVWFEERREDERLKREDEREARQAFRDESRAAEAAQAAWHRELDFQLVRLIHSDLATARHRRLAAIHELAVQVDGQTHTPEMLEAFRRVSERTASDLIANQIIATINLIPRSPITINLGSAVQRWNSNDYAIGGRILTRSEFASLHNADDQHWTEVTDLLDYHLRDSHSTRDTSPPG
ncbi:MAG: hypothetical protein AAGC53_03900 [Actinomycetota bacterium]